MTRTMVKGFVLAFAALISMAAISAAQLGLPELYPYPDDSSWLNPPSSHDSWPGQWPDGWPNQWEEPYPTPEPISGPSTPPGMGGSGSYSDSAPTGTRPGGYQPVSTPSASTGSPISYLDDGASLSERDVSGLPGGSTLLAPGGSASPLASGGTEAFKSYYGGTTQAYRRYYGGLQQWIYYCGRWTYGPAALWYGQQTNTIIRNDQYQRIWSYERYPNGYEAWQYWGYWYPGYHHAWFGADYRGWHQIAVWGSRSGWSNPIWVYVW